MPTFAHWTSRIVRSGSQCQDALGLVSRCAVLSAALAISLTAPSMAQQAVSSVPWRSTGAQQTFDDLPEAARRRLPSSLGNDEYVNALRNAPALMIDGTTISLMRNRGAQTYTITASRIEFAHGGRIVTNGLDLVVQSLEIASDGGEIVSFGQGRTNATSAPPGQAGMPGSGGGTVILDSSLSRNDILRVNLGGEDGQAGGPGLAGATGAKGPRGDNGSDHLFDCSHGGGNGGQGSPGGRGGNGGNGGQGGNGGRLILKGKLAAQRAQIEFSAPGGHGGDGGGAGAPGLGGPGGDGGNGSTYCRGGGPGPNGPPGQPGQAGHNGADGLSGQVFADVP